MMHEYRRRGPSEQPPEQELAAGRLQQILAPDHEVDAVAEVVHHHGELVGPLAQAVPQQQVPALRRRVLSRGPEPRVLEALDAGIDPEPHAPPGRPCPSPRAPAPARDTASPR